MQPNTLWNYKPFKLSTILFIALIVTVLILTALTRTNICTQYQCTQLPYYHLQCYAFAKVYCCNYVYLFCGDANCMPVDMNPSSNTCGGMLTALWIILGLSGLAVIAMIIFGYLFKKKVDTEIELAYRSAYVPPA